MTEQIDSTQDGSDQVSHRPTDAELLQRAGAFLRHHGYDGPVDEARIPAILRDMAPGLGKTAGQLLDEAFAFVQPSNGASQESRLSSPVDDERVRREALYQATGVDRLPTRDEYQAALKVALRYRGDNHGTLGHLLMEYFSPGEPTSIARGELKFLGLVLDLLSGWSGESELHQDLFWILRERVQTAFWLDGCFEEANGPLWKERAKFEDAVSSLLHGVKSFDPTHYAERANDVRAKLREAEAWLFKAADVQAPAETK